jgi:hypothetical protein
MVALWDLSAKSKMLQGRRSVYVDTYRIEMADFQLTDTSAFFTDIRLAVEIDAAILTHSVGLHLVV